jgi:hypothetical protein
MGRVSFRIEAVIFMPIRDVEMRLTIQPSSRLQNLLAPQWRGYNRASKTKL